MISLRCFTTGFALLLYAGLFAQSGATLEGVVSGNGAPLASATISVGPIVVSADSLGRYSASGISAGIQTVVASAVGFIPLTMKLRLQDAKQRRLDVELVVAGRQLNEVVVTGLSRATLIRESPVAVVSVSSASIDRVAAPNIIDALERNVPGLSVVKTGPNISKPFIRGLGYNRVLTLYDGIRQEGQQWGDEHGLEVDGYNTDKVEVIKGPASLMFGSDAVAGVVSLFPYVPTEKDGRMHGRLLSEYQHNNSLLGKGFRLGYSDLRWFWVMRGSYRVAKNYRNAIDGRVYNTGFREINAATSAGLTSEKGSSSINLTLYDNLQGIPDGSRDSLSRRFTKQVAEGAADILSERPLVAKQELDGYRLSPLHQHIQHYRLYSNIHYLLGPGQIDASIGLQQNIRREYSHPSHPGQAGMFVRLNTLNYGVRYVVPLDRSTDISFGVNGMYQANRNLDATDFPIPDYRMFDAGGYAHGKWKRNAFTVSGGLRYDRRTIYISDFFTASNTITGFTRQVAPPDTIGAKLQFPSMRKTFGGLSMSMGVTYRVNEALSVKANIARGYRSPTITELASNGLDPGAHIVYLGNSGFRPEFSFQQDIGAVARYSGIGGTLSLFNNQVQRFIYLTQLTDASGNAVTDAQGNRTFQYNQSAARLYGLEATLDIHPERWKGFSISQAFVLTRGVNRNKAYRGKGVNGEYLSLIAPAQYNGVIRQDIHPKSAVLPLINVGAEIQCSAAQHRYLALFNTETASPAYMLVNVFAGLHWKYDGEHLVRLQGQINNLFDRAYQSHLSRLKYFEYYASSPDGRPGIFNMGRNICLKLILDF